MPRYAALIVGLIAALGCWRLGFWQLSRLDERRERNLTIETRLAAPAIAVPEDAPASEMNSLTYRRVRLEGRADYRREIVVVGRSMGGVPGVHVVTPVVTAAGTAVLVERLWVPSPDASSVDLGARYEDSSLVVEGVIMPAGSGTSVSGDDFPLRVASLDPRALAPRFPYPIFPLTVRRSTGASTTVTLVPLPALTEGSHLSYAVQWFAFGLIALVGSVVLTIRGPVGWRERAPGGP